MDKDAERIAQDIKAIAQTRVAIAERLGAIEEHVGTTMQHARTMMTHLEDKTTSAVRETIQVTKDTFDPSIHAARHPWVFVGGALALGYAVGTLYYRGGWRVPSGVVPYYPPGTKGPAIMPMSGSPSSERGESGVYPFYPQGAGDKGGREQGQDDRLTVWAELEQALHDELGEVRKGVIRFGRGLFREMISQAVPALVQIIGNPRDGAPRSDRNSARR
ncbi:MAG: hypothetical protein ABI980_13540 [Nitrospirota bacterium]